MPKTNSGTAFHLVNSTLQSIVSLASGPSVSRHSAIGASDEKAVIRVGSILYCFSRPHEPCIGAAGHRRAGLASATTTISGKQLPPPDPKFGGVIKERASESTAWWPPRVVPPKKRAQRAAHHDRRRRLRLAQHLRRRDPDPGAGPHREERPALHELPLHFALLADAGGADYRAQPPLGGLRGGRRDRDRLPRLRLDHPDREGHHRHDPEGTTATRPHGSARTTTRPSSPTARPGRSTSGRTAWASSTSTASSAATPASGSRTCSATRRRSSPSRAIRAGT
jgi:hypothetical protein